MVPIFFLGCLSIVWCGRRVLVDPQQKSRHLLSQPDIGRRRRMPAGWGARAGAQGPQRHVVPGGGTVLLATWHRVELSDVRICWALVRSHRLSYSRLVSQGYTAAYFLESTRHHHILDTLDLDWLECFRHHNAN